MKKAKFAMLLVFAASTIVSCANAKTETTVNDSTATKTDSTKVDSTKVDSVAVVDTTAR